MAFTIGDLAKEFDVSLRTLRFYEDKDLIHPRRDGVTRIYSRRDRARLKLVIICLLYTSPSPRDLSTSRMPSSA